MSGMFAHIAVRILEKEYQVSCPAEEKANLLAAVELLNRKMREIRDSGKVVGLDRVAIMAALNLANELLKRTGDGRQLEDVFVPRVRAMSERVDAALKPDRRLNS